MIPIELPNCHRRLPPRSKCIPIAPDMILNEKVRQQQNELLQCPKLYVSLWNRSNGFLCTNRSYTILFEMPRSYAFCFGNASGVFLCATQRPHPLMFSKHQKLCVSFWKRLRRLVRSESFVQNFRSLSFIILWFSW